MRPAELGTDSAPEWLSWRHALEFLQQGEGVLPSAMISVPATAPLRRPEDIEQCLNLFLSGGVDVVVTVTAARRSPYFNMVEVRPNGLVAPIMPSTGEITRRQDVPAVFDMTTVAYVACPKFVLRNSSIFQGRVKAVEVPAARAIDIDDLLDFEIAEFLLSRRDEKCQD
jgi:N-acylneuraminate cytidylyltransferase